MPGSFSDYAEKKILDHIFGGAQFAVPSLYLGYFITDASEEGPGTEPVGSGYERIAVDPSYWLASTTQMVQNTKDIICQRTTGYHGDVVGIGLFDSSVGGNFLCYFPAESSVLVEGRDSLVILNGGLVHQFSPGGFSNYLKNAVLNHLYKGIPLPIFPTLFIGYMSTAPSDVAPGAEPSGGGYIRQAIANNSVNFSATGGGIKKTATTVQFPIASAPQGEAAHLGFWSAVSGGQFLSYGALNPSRSIDISDQLIFLAGDIKVTLD
jgi:hypothetical protein